MQSKIDEFIQQAYGLCDEDRVAVEVFESQNTETCIVEFLDVAPEEVEKIITLANNMEFYHVSHKEESRFLQVKIT